MLWVHLAGGMDFPEAWDTPSLVAVEPELVSTRQVSDTAGAEGALAELERLVEARRRQGGTRETGVAALLAYDLMGPAGREHRPSGPPDIAVIAVDRSLRFTSPGHAILTVRVPGDADSRSSVSNDWDRARRLIEAIDVKPSSIPCAHASARPVTSLPRETYLKAVERIKAHIAAGDIYQANLCQQFSVGHEGDSYELFRRLLRDSPAPQSAYVEAGGFALASASPESFLRVDADGYVETAPIKGTRPRGLTAESDAAAAQGLLDSPKDRAELLMIVDLERNDLGRVCETASVTVVELAALRSYAAVHHLVARIRGRLRAEVGIASLLGASFPSGSITGAPKIRAMQILHELEPARRNFFTGSLIWFGDDGSLDSSILIRAIVFDSGRATIGAGGGIVADSEPEQEWLESNHKARALTRALGFDPQEAS